MKLTLFRTHNSARSTMGKLFVDGVFQCFTLEDVVRNIGADGKGKVYGKTAIPVGTYKVIVNVSNRFKKRMPLLIDVPHFEGIRIHSGNTELDTDGCILVGLANVNDVALGHSRIAFNELMAKLEAAKTPITIEVRDK